MDFRIGWTILTIQWRSKYLTFLEILFHSILTDRQIWFEHGYRWENGQLRAIYHASDDCKFIIEDRVGTLHAIDLDKVELFAPSGGADIILSPERDSDLSINASFGEALLLFLIIPPGEYHLCNYKICLDYHDYLENIANIEPSISNHIDSSACSMASERKPCG